MDGRLLTPTASGMVAFPGIQRRVSVAAPAAGAEWKQTVPGGVYWRVLGGVSSFVASVAVANRLPGLSYTDGSVEFYRVGGSQPMTAGLTNSVLYLTSGQTAATGSTPVSGFNIATFWLPGGYTFGSKTPNIQAADQYGSTELFIEEMQLDLVDGNLAAPVWLENIGTIPVDLLRD